ncbi:methylamine dehydrogenase (amicyanin) small subunit [Paracoccus sp. CPCC 101403]|uniref:Methylamine dehydrogenase (amicyanin) n=2 Tax=Paracoccus broussonetiae TaxID=3075834 RepID=A0ABU3EE53_9RHOB|nr:methylamine dehydrogenase (amicyanin) small subunit [Paracoccus sp. CPCC 101403]MDT1062517.1 methylamine dehydrogenase (amicyanin) small subunit [Paracoccus sp. CPCC 101403]
MLGNFNFDNLVEKMSRRVAGRTSRRGAIGRLGTVLMGAAIVPLLPVDRRGRVSRANAAGAPEGTDPRAKFVPQDNDVQACDYWRHCSIDGNICDCSGGSLTNCPPGTKLASASWVASCYNPTDGQSYLIAYRDCCGQNVSGRCACLNTEGELPVYRPEFANDIIWCFGAEDDAMTYHCTISPIVGKAS